MSNQVELKTPIKIGDDEVKTVSLRMPTAGEMRGVSLAMVLRMVPEDSAVVLSRICDPMLSVRELEQMNGADFLNMASELAGMLMGE